MTYRHSGERMLVLEGLLLMPRPASQWCRHCRRKKANRSRGLCWSCFYEPTIRAQYPLKGARGESGQKAHHGATYYADRSLPTWSPPGSPEKIAVMTKRADRKQNLFHPLDMPVNED